MSPSLYSQKIIGTSRSGLTPVAKTTPSDAQHGFYARPRLRRWSIVWFASSFALVTRFGLPRRGHRLFGNVVSFW